MVGSVLGTGAIESLLLDYRWKKHHKTERTF
jgi:hypothetical protein